MLLDEIAYHQSRARKALLGQAHADAIKASRCVDDDHSTQSIKEEEPFGAIRVGSFTA